MNDEVIQNLKRLCRDYDGMTKLLTSMKNRLQAVNPEAIAEHQLEINGLEKIKDGSVRRIAKELELWPVYTEWLSKVKGVGPYIAGNLILLYYYRFLPICKKCGTKAATQNGDSMKHWCPKCEKALQGEGISAYAIEEKDFPNISKWWSYMGRGEGVPKRKKGEKANWSKRGRVVGYQFGDQINRRNGDDPYKAFFLARKKKREDIPDLSKGHRHNMARNETIKLFLAHFWIVARTLDSKPVTEPYSGTILGHTGIIEPFYFEPRLL